MNSKKCIFLIYTLLTLMPFYIMIFATSNTVLSPIIGHRWCKKIYPLIRGVRFLERWAILVLLSKIYYFYIYIWCSQGKWKTSESLGIKKRKKEMMLNCCNWKCFKTKYQLVNSIIQTLFYHKVVIDIALLFFQHPFLP